MTFHPLITKIFKDGFEVSSELPIGTYQYITYDYELKIKDWSKIAQLNLLNNIYGLKKGE